MNHPSQRKYNAAGKRIPHKKPPQPTLIKRSTARAFTYLFNHGLADFGKCNLAVMMARGPRTHLDKTGILWHLFPHRLAI